MSAELSEKMKDSTYKSAFDNYVENANYEKAGRAAKRERRIRDITSNKVVRTGAKIAGVAAAVGVGYKIASQNPVAQRKAKVFVDGIKQIGIVDLFASGQYTKTGRAYVLGNLLKDAALA